LTEDVSEFAVMSVSPGLAENHLLAALPDGELHRWQAQLERVEMPLGQVLCESGAILGHVYFPTTAIVSLLYVMENARPPR
jgi:hypothetical protein